MPAEVELAWDWRTKVFDAFLPTSPVHLPYLSPISPLYLPSISKVFDAFLSHKITDAKDIVLGWYNTFSAMTCTPEG